MTPLLEKSSPGVAPPGGKDEESVTQENGRPAATTVAVPDFSVGGTAELRKSDSSHAAAAAAAGSGSLVLLAAAVALPV
ncbi:hypothetical protein DQ04_11901000 [Trypanosoma grayi]|uniref:hypothetical protein n=1 Tax=Trypanosoma grayi TaxID=71804 RepID=UPI0004F42FE6|nr:hypothetical protein DQ04_11901000 [Trypanosoma grayi]KEG06858.1 hypothetical protein DQ04_11901000 [Trypanosoma grayi]